MEREATSLEGTKVLEWNAVVRLISAVPSEKIQINIRRFYSGIIR